MENRWISQHGGYRIVHSPLVDAVQASRDRVARDIVICRQAGSHTPGADDPEMLLRVRDMDGRRREATPLTSVALCRRTVATWFWRVLGRRR
jgi:hypothetical protein